MRVVTIVVPLAVAGAAVGCSSTDRDGAAPSPSIAPPLAVSPPSDAVAALADAPDDASSSAQSTHDHDALDPKLEALKQQLGASAVSCIGTAKLLASQGTAEPKVVRWREESVLRLCKADKWPARVRECVESATHDQLSCTAYLETAAQRRRWNAVFEKWIDPFSR